MSLPIGSINVPMPTPEASSYFRLEIQVLMCDKTISGYKTKKIGKMFLT